MFALSAALTILLLLEHCRPQLQSYRGHAPA